MIYRRSEYDKQGDKFLADHGILFKAVFVGNDCPPFCEDSKHIHGVHYLCTFARKDNPKKLFSLDFWNSWADCHRKAFPKAPRFSFQADMVLPPKPPMPYDVLACLAKYDTGTFEDFCGDYGYDTDSRKAEETFRAVDAEWHKVKRFFTAEELEEAREIQ